MHTPYPWDVVPQPDGTWLLKQRSQHVEMSENMVGVKRGKIIAWGWSEEDIRWIAGLEQMRAELVEALTELHSDVVSLVECIEECEHDGGKSYDTTKTRRLLGMAHAAIVKATGKE